jgi:hypothetical protein
MKNAWLVILLALSGCDSDPSFKIKDASCSAGFTDWYPDLTFHLLQDQSDGSFSYDPSGNVISELAGSYDLTSGDYEWDESFGSDHYLEERSVSGYGYANVNGDLDIVGTESYSDIAGQSWDIQFRVSRVGCEMENRRRFNVGGDMVERVEQGTFADDRYSYSRTTDRGSYIQEEEGYIDSNLEYSNTETIEASNYSSTTTTTGSLSEGTSLESFLQESDGNEFEGTIERFMTGGRAVKYDVRRPGETTGTWDYELDYFGTGSGTYTAGNTTCDIEFDEGDCSYDCGGGNKGSCS